MGFVQHSLEEIYRCMDSCFSLTPLRRKFLEGGLHREPAAGPLQGVTVVDCSVVLGVPCAAQQLGELGAEVVKVEAMSLPDAARGLGSSPAPGMAGLVSQTGRGKQSVVLDLKSKEGLKAFKRLIQRADILCQNFRPGAVERMGIDYESMKKINPDIIYLSSSAFGQTGPYAENRVYDPVIQMLAGIAHHQGGAGTPKLVGHAIIDKATGQCFTQAVLAALVARDRGAGGQHIVGNMLDVGLFWAWPDIFYNYTWQDLKTKEPAVSEFPKFVADQQEAGPKLSTLDALAEAEDEAWDWRTHALFGKFRAAKLPVTFSCTPPEPRPAAPMLGEQTTKLLSELGYSKDEVQVMLDKGAAVSTKSLLIKKGPAAAKKAKIFKAVEMLQGGPAFERTAARRGDSWKEGGPFSGLRVLDASSLLAGPLACATFADQGADVIKLELRGQLDLGRQIGPSPAGKEMGALFVAANRCKRSVVVDDKHGLEVALRLAESCDIIVTDGLDGLVDLTYDDVSKKNPKSILVTIKPSNEFATQAKTGMLTDQLEGGTMTFVKSLIVQKAAAGYVASAATAALWARTQGRGGQHVEVDVEQAGWHNFFYDGFWGDAWNKPKECAKFPRVGCVFQTLPETKDGRHIFTGALTDKEWKDFLVEFKVREHKLLKEDKIKKFSSIAGRVKNLDELWGYICPIVKEHTYDEYKARADKCGLICGQCQTYDEAVNDPQIKHNQTLTTVSSPLGTLRLPKNPIAFSRTGCVPPAPAPLPGEHSRALLLQAGFEESEVDDLLK